MRRSLVTLLIVTTNLCSLLDSYKINIDQSSKTIDAYDQQDSNLRKEYTEENYSNEDSSGRVVIGKWRSNGEALEPKWRDGDSVPLAPFSTISFQSGWGREPNSREDYRIEPESSSKKRNKHFEASLLERDDDIRGEESRAPNKKNLNSNSERFSDEKDENSKSITNPSNSATTIPTTEIYPLGKQRSGYKNSPHTETRFNAPDFDKENVNPSERRAAISKLLNTFREPSKREHVKENLQGGGKYRETLENYRNEGYELFENENDNPRPRKRRPPENYEFPGSWNANNRREESYAEDKNRPGVQNLSANMASDVRRYLTTNQDSVFETRNQTKSPENVELKTFLKMQGNNLSLSEILQQKNLTLADLLRGKPGAINILKSNNKKSESVQEEVATEAPERNWPSRRIIILRKSNKNSNSYSQNNSAILNISKTSDDVDTTTTSPVMETNNTNTELMSTKLEETRSNISSPDSTKFSNDVGIASSEKFDQINPPLNERDNLKQEFLKPLENRESLLVEATTVVEDGVKHLSNDGRVPTSNQRIVPANNDEDEIMEFSDYPAAKMPKFVVPVLYESGMPNNKRKNIPFSAIRKSNPAEDDDSKLSIENILSSKKKVSTIMNETHDVNEDNLGVKNIGVVDMKKKEDESLLIRNETREIKLRENENVNSRPTEYRNSMIDGKSENPRYKNERTAQTGTEEIAEKHLGNDFIKDAKERWINGNEMLPRDKKNLTLNHKLHEIVIPKVDPQSRAEILELFSSGSSAERLERLLASRNMTIEELIALRQRGSSQVHFAQVFKAKQQTPTSLPQNLKTNFKNRSNEATEKMVNELKEHEATLNVEENVNLLSAENSTTGKKKKTSETEGEYSATDLFNEFSDNEKLKKNFATFHKTSTSIPSLKPHEVNPNTESRTGVDLKKAIENSDLTMALEKLPVDNDIQKDSEGSSYFTSIEAVKLPVSDEGIKKAPDIFKERKTAVINSASSAEIGRVEEILNNDLKLITNAYGINDYEYSEKKVLSKVKPSIIASGGILGVTVVVFLSIFIACRIQQKKKFAYKNSFSKAVFHNPVMTARKLSNTSSVNTIMIDIVATSTPKRPQKHDAYETDDFEPKSDIDNDSLDANDSWDTIPDFMK